MTIESDNSFEPSRPLKPTSRTMPFSQKPSDDDSYVAPGGQTAPNLSDLLNSFESDLQRHEADTAEWNLRLPEKPYVTGENPAVVSAPSSKGADRRRTAERIRDNLFVGTLASLATATIAGIGFYAGVIVTEESTMSGPEGTEAAQEPVVALAPTGLPAGPPFDDSASVPDETATPEPEEATETDDDEHDEDDELDEDDDTADEQVPKEDPSEPPDPESDESTTKPAADAVEAPTKPDSTSDSMTSQPTPQQSEDVPGDDAPSAHSTKPEPETPADSGANAGDTGTESDDTDDNDTADDNDAEEPLASGQPSDTEATQPHHEPTTTSDEPSKSGATPPVAVDEASENATEPELTKPSQTPDGEQATPDDTSSSDNTNNDADAQRNTTAPQE